MHLSENEGIEGNVFAVTGGLGFVGSALCFELVRRGARLVRAFDLRFTSPWSDLLNTKGVHCIQGDVTQKKDVENALRGADCVFHLASYGMSGKEMLQLSRVDEVNINGTCHILDACHEFGIKRLVYVSTYNVVFGGKEIVNGNESLPYFPLDDHVDSYGRSKSIAEQLVLKTNGRPSKESGKILYTCAIRPAAIYGPGEERHLPRIISYAKLGLLPFRIGESSVKQDWVYVDNLVLALILASMGLLDDIPGKGKTPPAAAGQPYFICDGSPVNTIEFLRPLLRSLDYDFPNASLAVPHALILGKFFGVVYTILYPWLNRPWLPQPLILPAEVYKVTVLIGDPIDFNDILNAEESQVISRGRLYDAVSTRIGNRLQDLKTQVDKLSLEHALQVQNHPVNNSNRAAVILHQVDWESFGMGSYINSENENSFPKQGISYSTRVGISEAKMGPSSDRVFKMGFGYEGGIVSRIRGYMNPTELMGFAAKGLFINHGGEDSFVVDVREVGPLKAWKHFFEANLLQQWNSSSY